MAERAGIDPKRSHLFGGKNRKEVLPLFCLTEEPRCSLLWWCGDNTQVWAKRSPSCYSLDMDPGLDKDSIFGSSNKNIPIIVICVLLSLSLLYIEREERKKKKEEEELLQRSPSFFLSFFLSFPAKAKQETS